VNVETIGHNGLCVCHRGDVGRMLHVQEGQVLRGEERELLRDIEGELLCDIDEVLGLRQSHGLLRYDDEVQRLRHDGEVFGDFVQGSELQESRLLCRRGQVQQMRQRDGLHAHVRSVQRQDESLGIVGVIHEPRTSVRGLPRRRTRRMNSAAQGAAV